jgi:hypothetical protein
MNSNLRMALSVTCLVAVATLLECGGGSSQKISLLTITTATLPNGTAGTAYNQPIQANGGVAPFKWTLSAGTPPNNLQLNPSNTKTATISGMPDMPVQGDAFTVKVTDAANQSATQPFNVSILGVPDTLTLSSASLTFNPQVAGTTSVTQTVTLTNAGSSSVAINSVMPTGTNAGDFSQSNNCGSDLAPGAHCEISVTFTPSQPGPRVASISVNDDTTGTPHQLGLNGIGLSSGANATLSANSLTFDGQEIGTTSPPLTLTLTNYGEAILNIVGIAASGSFSESTTCGPTLAPGANCPIHVSFSPATSGTLTGTLSLTGNMTGSPQTVALNGTGAASGTPVLTGMCAGPGDGNLCTWGTDLAECPAGEAALAPTNMLCMSGFNTYVNIDNSRGCTVKTRSEDIPGGRCATVAATSSSKLAASGSCKSSVEMEKRSAQ